MKIFVPLSEIATSLPCHYGDECPPGILGTPVAKVSNINSAGQFHRDFEYRFLSDRQLPDLLVQEGDLLVVKSSGSKANILSGKTAYCDKNVAGALVASNFLMRLRVDPCRAHARYVWHVLNSESSKAFVRRIAGTTTYPNLKWTTYSDHPIPLPPLEEQRRIAAILNKVALLIQSAAQAFCLSQELKKSLVHETFGLAREGEERVRIKVRDVADMITGFPFKSAHYTDKAQHTRLCRGINVLPDRIEWKQVARWPEITLELRSYQIDEDDILIAMDRPWITEGFKIARVKPTDIPSLLVQRVARIRAGNQILPRILFEVLSSKAFATHCTPTETTVPHISPIEIREYEFELPCLKEQKRIDSILAEIEKSQAAMNQRANLLKEKLCRLSRSYFN